MPETLALHIEERGQKSHLCLCCSSHPSWGVGSTHDLPWRNHGNSTTPNLIGRVSACLGTALALSAASSGSADFKGTPNGLGPTHTSSHPPAWQEIPSFLSSASTKADARVCGSEGWKLHQHRRLKTASAQACRFLLLSILLPWKCLSKFYIKERLYAPLPFIVPVTLIVDGVGFFLIEWSKRVLFTFILKLWGLDLLENCLWALWISYLHRSSHLYLLLYIWPQSSKSLRHVNNFQRGSSPREAAGLPPH